MIEEGNILQEFFRNNPWIGGIIMAVTMSALRVIYDREETSMIRIGLESLICGALTLSVGSALMAMGYGQEWYLFCGGMIGFMGSQSLRALAYRLFDKKIGK